MNTVIDRVKTALVDRGEELTNKQIAARYGTRKPRQIIYQLREEGYDIEGEKRVDTKGRVKYKYFAV